MVSYIGQRAEVGIGDMKMGHELYSGVCLIFWLYGLVSAVYVCMLCVAGRSLHNQSAVIEIEVRSCGDRPAESVPRPS
jgi:hypothetical protein